MRPRHAASLLTVFWEPHPTLAASQVQSLHEAARFQWHNAPADWFQSQGQYAGMDDRPAQTECLTASRSGRPS